MYCETKHFNIGKFFVEKNAINVSPEYQRQAGAWGRDKQHLFLHSLFASYDVPKIYMHKLPTNGGLHEYALVDGKQRLQCIWDFLEGKIDLGSEHEDFVPDSNAQKQNTPFPSRGNYYNDLSAYWQEQFRATNLDVVVIHDADDQDIESLFLRLNNGEPLNAAEKRNAFGGTMCPLIRDIAKHKFFTEKFPKENKRCLHEDIAARFLLIEDSVDRDHKGYCTLKKRFLDDLVNANDTMSTPETERRRKAVNKQLNTLCGVFDKKDPLLAKAGYPQLYYLFVKEMEQTYADEKMLDNIYRFISGFAVKRTENLKIPPEQKSGEEHPFLDEFEHMMGQGNDSASLKTRVKTLTQFFLFEHPETKLRGKQRNFSDAERYVIYIYGGKKCAECQKEFKEYSDFEADHVIPWVHSGDTSLKNAQALCIRCNRRKNSKAA